MISKIREQWVRFGDRNTKFFHTQAIVRRRRNKVHGLLLSNGDWCTDLLVLKEETISFFKDLFSSQENYDAHTL